MYNLFKILKPKQLFGLLLTCTFWLHSAILRNATNKEITVCYAENRWIKLQPKDYTYINPNTYIGISTRNHQERIIGRGFRIHEYNSQIVFNRAGELEIKNFNINQLQAN